MSSRSIVSLLILSLRRLGEHKKMWWIERLLLEFLCIFVSPARFYWSLLISRVEGRVEAYYYFFNLLWAIYSVSLCIFFLSEDNSPLVDCQFTFSFPSPSFFWSMSHSAAAAVVVPKDFTYSPTFSLSNSRSFINFFSSLSPSAHIKLPSLAESSNSSSSKQKLSCVRGNRKWKLALMAANWVSEWAGCWLRALESKQASKQKKEKKEKKEKATIMDANSSYRERDIVINNESSVWLIGGEQRECCLHCGAFCLLSFFFLFGSVGNSAVLLFSNGKTVSLSLLRHSLHCYFFCSSAQL